MNSLPAEPQGKPKHTHTHAHTPHPPYWVTCLVVSDSLQPYGLTGSSVQGISRQEYWSGLLCPSPGDLPNPGIEPESLMSPALADGLLLLLLFLPLVPPGKPPMKLKDTCSLEEKL